MMKDKKKRFKGLNETSLNIEDIIPLLKAMMYSPRWQNLRLMLSFINKSGEVYQYTLPKFLRCSYRNVLRLLHFLEKFGFAEIVRTEPSSKHGKDKNIWRLTEKGTALLQLLS